jgi:hypothetical protein
MEIKVDIIGNRCIEDRIKVKIYVFDLKSREMGKGR